MTATAHVLAIRQDSFQRDVIDESHHRPVLVDFWADWCAPCQQLMPVLTRLAESYAGKFRLAKVDTEAERELAADHGIRSLPTLRLYRHGQVVDELLGAQPEAVIRAAIEAHLERPSDAPRSAGRAALAAGDAATAVQQFTEAMALDPDRPDIQLELAEAQLTAGNGAAAEALLAALPIDYQTDKRVQALRTQAEFIAKAGNAGDIDALRARIAQDDNDLAAREALAARCMLQRDYDTALEQYLEIMRRDRAFNDDAGRRGLVATFELLGSEDARVKEYRKRMATLLY